MIKEVNNNFILMSEVPPFCNIFVYLTIAPPSNFFIQFFKPTKLCSMASVNKIKKTAVISQEDVVVTERENYSKVLLQKTCMMFPASKPNQISEKEINIVDDGDSSR